MNEKWSSIVDMASFESKKKKKRNRERERKEKRSNLGQTRAAQRLTVAISRTIKLLEG